MKQKIVINVPMHSEKAKSKAMMIAVAIQGVMSVSVGKNDRLEVIGEEVDSVCLTKCLRKKFCFADIMTLDEVKPPKPPPVPPPPRPPVPPPPCPSFLPPPPPLYYECWVADAPPPPSCSIM